MTAREHAAQEKAKKKRGWERIVVSDKEEHGGSGRWDQWEVGSMGSVSLNEEERGSLKGIVPETENKRAAAYLWVRSFYPYSTTRFAS